MAKTYHYISGFQHFTFLLMILFATCLLVLTFGCRYASNSPPEHIRVHADEAHKITVQTLDSGNSYSISPTEVILLDASRYAPFYTNRINAIHVNLGINGTYRRRTTKGKSLYFLSKDTLTPLWTWSSREFPGFRPGSSAVVMLGKEQTIKSTDKDLIFDPAWIGRIDVLRATGRETEESRGVRVTHEK